jgi:hypothetical protein
VLFGRADFKDDQLLANLKAVQVRQPGGSGGGAHNLGWWGGGTARRG